MRLFTTTNKWLLMLRMLVLILLLNTTITAKAETVLEKIPVGLPVFAEYIQGDMSKPAIIVLHGFLQTYDFLATRNIINGLSNLNYSVLAPNLSLGVPSRKQSVQCQAAHKHTFTDDMREIDYWIGWLQQQGHPSVILMGHSWGSQHSLGYALLHPDSPVSAIVAIGLVRSQVTIKQRQQQYKEAQARASRNDESLQPYQLSFCKNYMASAKSYLSYARWNDDYVIKSLKKLRTRDIEVFVILGGQDKRIDETWIKQLHSAAAHLTVIEGANHFFSHIFEFELNDQIEKILGKLETR